MRKYKSKNNKKILLSNIHANEAKEENEDFEKQLEKLEKVENQIKNKSPFDKKQGQAHLIDSEDKKNNKTNNQNEKIEMEENKEESNIDTTEDDDFLILKSVAKLKHELSEKEKNCEDLHGWDEDF